MNTLKTNIKNEMEKKSWSVHALERQAGLRPSAIRNILYGRSKNPSLSVIQSIANALECSVADLIDEETEEKSKTDNVGKGENRDNLPWNQQLYLRCIHQFLATITERPIQLKRESIMSVIDDAYFYSSVNNLEKPDQNFLNWLIEKCKE